MKAIRTEMRAKPLACGACFNMDKHGAGRSGEGRFGQHVFESDIQRVFVAARPGWLK